MSGEILCKGVVFKVHRVINSYSLYAIIGYDNNTPLMTVFKTMTLCKHRMVVASEDVLSIIAFWEKQIIIFVIFVRFLSSEEIKLFPCCRMCEDGALLPVHTWQVHLGTQEPLHNFFFTIIITSDFVVIIIVVIIAIIVTSIPQLWRSGSLHRAPLDLKPSYLSLFPEEKWSQKIVVMHWKRQVGNKRK